MRIAGVDLSLRATGVAVASTATATSAVVECWKPKERGTERLAWLRSQVERLVEQHRPDLVVLEAYAFSRHDAYAHELGEAGGVVRLALADADVPWCTVAPTSLKKYATGKGNASKEQVLVEAVRRLGYDGHDNNEADALWLAAMAVDHYGGPCHVPQSHRAGLGKVQWAPARLVHVLATDDEQPCPDCAGHGFGARSLGGGGISTSTCRSCGGSGAAVEAEGETDG